VSVQPGKDLVFLPDGGDEVKVTVPELAAGIDIANDRILGSAPAGGELSVSVVEGPGITDALTQMVTAAADGSYSVDLSGTTDAQPGHAGDVSWTDEHNNTFHAFFAALAVEVTIGARNVTGTMTPGDTVSISLAAEDGAAKGSTAGQLLGDYTFDQPQDRRDRRNFGPIAVGDEISITQTSAIPGASITIAGRIDPITIDNVSPPDRLVQGTVVAGANVEVEAISPYDGAVYSASAVADENGIYVVEIVDADGMGPGWRLRATYKIAPGLSIRALESIEQVRVGVHQQTVEGIADPGSTITVTLRAQDGTEKAVDSDNVGNNGNFNVAFPGDDGLQIGDRVEVAFVLGDPVIVNVEAISARTNHLADTVSGDAPNSAEVIITQGNGNNQVLVTTDVKVDGTYSASFAGTLDIEPPMNGQMVARLLSGHELFTTWAAVRMTTELREPFLSGNGPANRSVVAQLLDKDGVTVVATGSDTIGGGGGGQGPGGGFGGGGGGNWFFNFSDDAGDPVDVRPLDIIRATVGDDVFEITVPQLRGVAFVEDDIVNGETSGARDVNIALFRPLIGDQAEADVASGEDGAFSFDFTDLFDLQHNDVITFQTREQGHNVNSQIFVPGLRLNLDTGVLNGSWRPTTQVIVQLRDAAGGSRFQSITTTDEDALFQLSFENAGTRIVPNTGDVVRVQPVGAGAAMELTVPKLEVNLDKDSDVIGGTTEPGGHLEIRVVDMFRDQGNGNGPQNNDEPEIAADGTWTAQFQVGGGGPGGQGVTQGNRDVVPGTRVTADYRVPIGHIVRRQRYEPLLNVQAGGAKVCGFVGEPRAMTSAELRVGGAVTAQANGQAGYNSGFDLLLTSDGSPALSAASNLVSAMLGDVPAQVEIPDVTLNVNWNSGQIQGTGPAATLGQVLWPARDCLDPQRNARNFRVNGQGNFQTGIQGGLRQPGDGFEIAFFTEEGHRHYRHIYRSLGQVYVHSDHVVGRAISGQPVAITVVGADGSEKGRATTIANTDGRFGADVVGTGGASVMILPGDTVGLVASGETVEIAVEELNFDWSPGTDIAAQAEPGREVEIVMQLTDGRIIDVDRVAGSNGRLSYGASDVPPRATWSMAEVVGVRMIVTLDNDHQILAEAGDVSSIPLDPPVDTVDPGTNGLKIFMPFANR
jgi:hypothetical protein